MCDTTEFRVYVKVRESLYTQAIIEVDTIPSHIDTRSILLGYEGLGLKVFAWYVDLNGIKNKNSVKHPYPNGIEKCEILIIETWMVSKRDKIRPTLFATNLWRTKLTYHIAPH